MNAAPTTHCWLVGVRDSKSAICAPLRIEWRTVGPIITRLIADIDARVDRRAGVTRIGIDEVSYKRGHKYLTIVVDHDSGNLWAAVGRDTATVDRFLEPLGPERCAQLTHTSADAAEWIARRSSSIAPKPSGAPTRVRWWPGQPTPSTNRICRFLAVGKRSSVGEASVSRSVTAVVSR